MGFLQVFSHFSIFAKISVSQFQNRQGVVAQTRPGGSSKAHNKYLIPIIIFMHIEIRGGKDDSSQLSGHRLPDSKGQKCHDMGYP
jgi:hypothetical protein